MCGALLQEVKELLTYAETMAFREVILHLFSFYHKLCIDKLMLSTTTYAPNNK